MSDQGLFFILREDWNLRGYKNNIFLAFNWKRGKRRFLTAKEMAVLRLCDGITDFSSPAIPPEYLRICEKMQQEEIVGRCIPGSSLLMGQEFRQADNSYIAGLLLSVTNRCNFRCRHCFVEAPSGRYSELSHDQLMDLLNQFEQANVPDIALTGGEPFARGDLFDFLEGMNQRRIGFTELFSNAALLTEEKLDRLTSLGFHPHFKVSFDCVGSHDYMRGVPGAEQQTLRGIRLLREKEFPVTVITSIDKIVIQGLSSTLHLLKDLGVSNWWMAPPMEVGNWKTSDSTVDLEELMPALKKLLREWKDEGRPFDLQLWRLGRYHKEGKIYRGFSAPYTDESEDCYSTHRLPYIMPDGTLIPCGSYSGHEITSRMPNLMDVPLNKAWDDPFLRSICDLKKGDVRKENPSCRSCPHFSECGSGCRISALLTKGSLMRNDPVFCRLYRGGYMDDFHAFANSLDDAGVI